MIQNTKEFRFIKKFGRFVQNLKFNHFLIFKSKVKLMKKILLRKTLLMSKYLFQLIIAEVIFSSLAFSTPVTSQSLLNKSIKCKWNNAKLTNAFSEIQNKTDLFFAYSIESVQHIRIKNEGKNLNVGDFLKYVSAETGLSFKLKDEIVYVYEDSLLQFNKTKS